MSVSGILVVEDERIVAKDIENSLRKMGYKICGAVSTAADAIRKTLELRPDLVLMDVQLKGDMDGIEAADHIRSKLHVPIIFLTAHADENTLARAKVTGPSGYILKPFTDKDLHIAIDMALHRYTMDCKLKESEERYRLVFETSRDAIFVLDPQGLIVDCNGSLTELLLLPMEDLIGKEMSDLFADPHEMSKIKERLDRDRFFKDYEITLYGKDKKPIECRITCSIMVDGNHGMVGYQGSIQDIRQQKRLEEQLLHSQKLEAIGTLASGIAHDFNNILTGIMGYGTVLQSGMAAEDPRQEFAEQIVLSCEKAADLTRSLLTFSRKQPAEIRPVFINSIITDIKKLLTRLVKAGIVIETILSDDFLKIMADSGQIEQILMNIVINANDALPEGGTITITTTPAHLDERFIETHGYGALGDYVLMTISDTGCGMDKATKDRIFEPFFTTKEAGKGTGLGLALAYSIIKQHKGWIDVYSEKGIGTAFKIYLPLVDSVVGFQEKADSEKPRGGKETILVAEDSAQVRTFIKLVLMENGYCVIEAADGEEAMARFEESAESIDLMVLDIIMPKADGRSVYKAAQKIRSEIKAVFMSGYTFDTIKEHHGTEHEIHFVQKPLRINELLKTVRDTIDGVEKGWDS